MGLLISLADGTVRGSVYRSNVGQEIVVLATVSSTRAVRLTLKHSVAIVYQHWQLSITWDGDVQPLPQGATSLFCSPHHWPFWTTAPLFPDPELHAN